MGSNQSAVRILCILLSRVKRNLRSNIKNKATARILNKIIKYISENFMIFSESPETAIFFLLYFVTLYI